MYIYTNNSNAIYYYCERYWEVKQYNYYSGIVNIEKKNSKQISAQTLPFRIGWRDTRTSHRSEHWG